MNQPCGVFRNKSNMESVLYTDPPPLHKEHEFAGKIHSIPFYFFKFHVLCMSELLLGIGELATLLFYIPWLVCFRMEAC